MQAVEQHQWYGSGACFIKFNPFPPNFTFKKTDF